MDFNPLDILAAAALGQKDGSSDLASSKKEDQSAVTTSSKDANNAEEDPEEDMGKTAKIKLKSYTSLKEEVDTVMPPHKTPWSPNVFLTSDLEDQIQHKHEKISIIELMQDLRNSAFGKKEHQQNITSVNDHVKDSLGNNNNKINSVSIKNEANLQEFRSNVESELNERNIELVNGGVGSFEDKEPLGTDSTPENVDHNSDTDTAESVDISNSKVPDPEQSHLVDFIGMDHPYASIQGQERPSPSTEALSEEDDIDVCSPQHSPLNGHSPHYSHNMMSPDCHYLKSGIFEDISSGNTDLYKISSYGRARLPSSSSSTSSPTLEMSSKCVKEEDVNPSQCTTSAASDLGSPDKKASKYGKFRIGTFASFSSNNLELEKYLRNKDSPVTNGRKLNIGIPSEINFITSSLSSPTASPSLHPLLQSPIQDWDRSEAGSEVHDDSSESRTPHRLSPDFTCEKVTEWCHPLFHDHDYCLKEGEIKQEPDDALNASLVKRKYTKRKSKLDLVNQEKILKAKYLKKELLKKDPPKKIPPELDFSNIESSVSKSNPVGRPKKRPLERPIEEEIDPETGTKLKITGKFQDQYVYYMSKSSRTTSRRRQTPLPFPSDKIIVPAPKPGDIVVPHLTDADIETVRLKGRAALNLPGRPHGSNHVERLPQTGSVSSHHNDYDEDSHIVSTILSMENDNLSSAPSPAHSDIAGSSGLNPDQPALTESLQLMSGDNSITSEHVLNYLLSVVKEDVPNDNLLNGSGVEASSSALFPSLPSDSVYSKVDHFEESDLSQSGDHSVQCNSVTEDALEVDSKNSHDHHLSHSIHNSHLAKTDNFTSSVVKEDKDHGHLPDDLSSFMSNSQGTSSSSSNTSQGVFSSDLSSLGTPQLSSSFPRLTSIEKTLDFLGVKDGDIKLDHTDLFTSRLHSETESSTLLTPESIASTEDDTPWIVTVTLYFNDVPAIMVNNQPYIRLVDIHKQILPAKDTGILKKRCQLLKIPVLNCSEMQRYFLVQYGRAYNSKSTLIISKDQATELVTYYATPQPRTGKVDEGSPQGRSSVLDSDPGLSVTGVSAKKRSNKNGKKAASPNGLLESQYPKGQKDSPLSDPESSVQAPSKRTRHKKINYLEMLRGEEKKSSEDSILETIESVVKASPDYLDKLTKQSSSSNSKQHSKKKLKSIDRKAVKKTNKTKVKSKHHPKLNKDRLGSLVHRNKADRTTIHIQDNEAWMKKHGTLVSDSDVSKEFVSGKFRHQPLKLKVNSLLNFSSQKRSSSTSPIKRAGLFSRSNSSAGSSEAALRVLAVAHQAAALGGDNESRLPSQPADIHLDLFIKSSSPCVCCQTCSQFLSVPHFMRHHHVPMDSEWLATEAAHRILVPRNKENISEQEKKLWEEFHALQEAIGGFGDESDSEEEEDSSDDFDIDDDPGSLTTPGTLSLLKSNTEQFNHRAIKSNGVSQMSSVTTAHAEEEGEHSSSEDEDDGEDEPCLSPKTMLADRLSQRMKNEMASRCGLVPRMRVSQAEEIVGKGSVQSHNSNLRTSNRKRKSKQLFSIENYLTSKKTAPGDESDILSCSADLSRAADVGIVCSPIKAGRLSV